jgi:hypothetical protein
MKSHFRYVIDHATAFMNLDIAYGVKSNWAKTVEQRFNVVRVTPTAGAGNLRPGLEMTGASVGGWRRGGHRDVMTPVCCVKGDGTTAYCSCESASSSRCAWPLAYLG